MARHAAEEDYDPASELVELTRALLEEAVKLNAAIVRLEARIPSSPLGFLRR